MAKLSIEFKNQLQANTARYIKRNQEYVLEYLKENPCIDCGETDPIVLDFDHVNRKEKYRSIALMIRRATALNKIIEEISKCVVRCANCHRRKTSKELGWFRSN